MNMMSIRYSILFLLNLSFVNNAQEKPLLQSWIVQKLQGLENTVQRVGCQQYLAHGYKYQHMYAIDGIAFDNVVLKRRQGALKQFEMHLAVKTSKDAIILLSPTANPGADDLVYEIGVGIGVNLFTILRLTKDSKNEVARVSTENILSPTQYTKFYLKIFEDLLTFGKEGEAPLISYHDARLRNVKYFDVSSWGDTDAKFLYDCPETSQIYCYYKSA